MQQLLYTFSFSLLLFLSCGGKQSGNQTAKTGISEYPKVVPFESGMANEQELALSQIAERVEYIPLETTSACLIKRPKAYVRYVDGKYIISCAQAVYMFDENGKFIRQLGSHGNGPGEYDYVQFVDADAKNGYFYLQTFGKLNTYTLDGKFVKDLPIPDATNVGQLNDSLFACYMYNSNGQIKNRLILLNEKGHIVQGFRNYDHFEVANNMSYVLMNDEDRYLFRFKDNLCFRDYYNDTLFTVTETALLPRYVFQLGKYAIPLENRWETANGDWNKYKREASKYLQINTIETEHYVFMPCKSWDGDELSGLVLYDKDKNTCFKMKENSIPNDLDGGIPFEPFTSIGDNTMLTMWAPDKIMELAKKDPSILKHDKLKNLKEDDNPVLMIVHLK